MNFDNLKKLLSKYNLKPNFTYGQNFLVDEEILDDIIEAAEITSADQILEIGAGIGNLTERLLQQAGFVLSIEKDPKFFPILKSIKKNHKDNFRFEIADALEFNYQEIFLSRSGHTDINPDQQITTDARIRSYQDHPDAIRRSGSAYKVVANIPYFITGKILEMFMSAKFKPTSVTVLTQKEVAQRVTAKAGDYSLLAISVQLFGAPKIIRIVPRQSFYPAPKVDSAILKIDLYEKPRYKIEDEKKFFHVLRACFAGKRKQLHNTLVNNLKLPKEKVQQVLQDLKIDPTVRPQELTIEEWEELVKQISNYSNF